MTTTLRPAEPLQQHEDGTRSGRYRVCVNSRPVGVIHLATHPVFGPAVARIVDLRIDEPDRGRGRGTVAALAAEEVVRGWGCTRIEAEVPAAAEGALRLLTALQYTQRNRNLRKTLGSAAPALPAGSRGRPMTDDEYGPWLEQGKAGYARSWTERGVPEDEARAKSAADHARLLPQGRATPGMLFSVLEHQDTAVGTLWLATGTATGDGRAFVYDVEVDARHRGRGHGRSLMLLAEAQALAAGARSIGLNVFAGNTPAERLYDSLGYRPVLYVLHKQLL
ncbi:MULTISPECIES: GNAT family N-acetyltransferase [Streptomyces]|uniref:GNAT family N-acetyltransferase n=1 Tax=Streptomyces TaxID=1883 RepID=UPI000F741A9F|nr:GNAT family N-acetyltransferase [Streptomyces sp. WAC00469]RSS08871.1 GNAT family N-acetyltransferase [Streptomyces sp. WAC00469]WTD49986.1 GNAT family N-acetyltransferase [Streptomyces thermoviolaceus]